VCSGIWAAAAGGEVSSCSGVVLEKKEGEYVAMRQEGEDGMTLNVCSPSGRVWWRCDTSAAELR
jgi:hypothetical protein